MKVLFNEKGSNHLAVSEFEHISLYDDHSALVFNTSFGRTYTLAVLLYNGEYCVIDNSQNFITVETIIRKAFAADRLDLSSYTLVEEDDTDEE